MFKMDMTMKNMVPRITASVHWPVMKEEKIRWLRENTSTTWSAPFRGRRA